MNFALLGAYRFLNITMSDIANRCLDLGDLLGDTEADRLANSLHDAADWPARFDLMDRFLLERLRRGRPMSPDVAWALKSVQASHGARSIGALSRDLACSRKTLIQRFHAQVGLSPKAVASILRFAHAVERIRTADVESWADLAIACGYYDQAHFNRDFRRYSGRTPRSSAPPCCPTAAGSPGKIHPRLPVLAALACRHLPLHSWRVAWQTRPRSASPTSSPASATRMRPRRSNG